MSDDPSDPAPDSDRADYVRRLIAHRAPELSQSDIAELSDAPPDSDMVPVEVVRQILDVISAMVDRLDGIERTAHAGA